jgi:hypothetical protein
MLLECIRTNCEITVVAYFRGEFHRFYDTVRTHRNLPDFKMRFGLPNTKELTTTWRHLIDVGKGKGKGKGNVLPITGHEGPEEE